VGEEVLNRPHGGGLDTADPSRKKNKSEWERAVPQQESETGGSRLPRSMLTAVTASAPERAPSVLVQTMNGSVGGGLFNCSFFLFHEKHEEWFIDSTGVRNHSRRCIPSGRGNRTLYSTIRRERLRKQNINQCHRRPDDGTKRTSPSTS
jgi:hypothetical protein